jgi:hypothetical protein
MAFLSRLDFYYNSPFSDTVKVYVSKDDVNYALSKSITIPGTCLPLSSNLGSFSRYVKFVFDSTPGGVSANYNETDFIELNKVRNLTASLERGGSVKLWWKKSAAPCVKAYNIYWDNGTGIIDYSIPYQRIAVLPFTPEINWTSTLLVQGIQYKFVVRTISCDVVVDEVGNPVVDGGGNPVEVEENNDAPIVVTPVDSCDGKVKATIKIPENGKRIGGNRAQVMAELACGTESVVKEMLFQYKLESASNWTNITPAEPNHPNPDANSPYFVHWNVDTMTSGRYNIRVVASNLASQPDPSPAFITVEIDNQSPDSVGNSASNGKKENTDQVVKGGDNKIEVANSQDNSVDTVTIPEDALDSDTSVKVKEKNTNEVPAADSRELQSTGEYREVTLDNGQTNLNNNKKAEVEIAYQDTNQDGIVDGTQVNENDLVVASYNESTGKWEKANNSSVDKEKNTVKGDTGHFSLFGAFGQVQKTRPSGMLGGGGCSITGAAAGSGAAGTLVLMLAPAVWIAVRRKNK